MGSPLVTLWLKESAYNQILEHTVRKMPLETGGVLLGYWGNLREAVVTAVVGPGPGSVHRKRSFVPDNRFHIQQVSDHYALTGRTETYLGDWHTHPKSSAYLSSRDKSTLAAIADYEEARLSQPLMMVLGTKPFGLRAWIHTDENGKMLTEKVTSECAVRVF